MNENDLGIYNSPISPENLGRLVKLIKDDVISGKIAKDVLLEMFNSKKNPEKIIEEKGLKQVTDISQIKSIVEEVINENQKMVEQYLSGKDKLLGFFVGQAMKKNGNVLPMSKPITKVAPINPRKTPIHLFNVIFSFNIGPANAFVSTGWSVTIKAAIPVGRPIEIE